MSGWEKSALTCDWETSYSRTGQREHRIDSQGCSCTASHKAWRGCHLEVKKEYNCLTVQRQKKLATRSGFLSTHPQLRKLSGKTLHTNYLFCNSITLSFSGSTTVPSLINSNIFILNHSVFEGKYIHHTHIVSGLQVSPPSLPPPKDSTWF